MDDLMLLFCAVRNWTAPDAAVRFHSPSANVRISVLLLPAHMHLGHFSLSPSSCFSILLSSIVHMYAAQGSYIKVSRASLQGGWLLARTSLLVILPHCSCFMGSWVTLSQILKKLNGESWWTPISLPLLFRPQAWLMTSMCLVQSNMCRGPGVSNSVHWNDLAR